MICENVKQISGHLQFQTMQLSMLQNANKVISMNAIKSTILIHTGIPVGKYIERHSLISSELSGRKSEYLHD